MNKKKVTIVGGPRSGETLIIPDFMDSIILPIISPEDRPSREVGTGAPIIEDYDMWRIPITDGNRAVWANRERR